MQQWFDYSLHRQDLVITEGMATDTGLIAFDRLGYLRIPEEDIPVCTEALIQRGVRPDRWYCTLHARESGYKTAAPGKLRNANLETFRAATVHIIQNLGGQVVRLGHPEMTKFGPMEGLLELGCEPDTTLLQAFAVSRSRYLVCGPSGPLAFGDAFHVPTAYANAISVYFCNDRAVVRTIDLQAPDGTIINQERFADTPPGLNAMIEKGYIPLQISADELVRLVNRLHEKTSDTPEWRVPDPPFAGPRPNKLIWPGNFRPRGEFLEVPA
jgi:putative glycosyltransferase (TIGR04372 family)